MVENALRLALPGAVLLAGLWLSLTFRYDAQVWGNSVLVHDRWLGTLERCVDNAGISRCRPMLNTGMLPIQSAVSDGAKPKPTMSDEQFKQFLDRLPAASPQVAQ